MDKIAVVLQYTFSDDQDADVYNTVLYAIEDTKVDINSNITTHPIITGEMVADYMYRMPVSYTISGSYSQNGDCMSDLYLGHPTITQFQEHFERINKEGRVCWVMKGRYNGRSVNSYTFTRRRNMVLSRISWTEKTNAVDFDFTFTEVLRASVEDMTYVASDIYDDGYLTPSNSPVYGTGSEVNSGPNDAGYLMDWIFNKYKVEFPAVQQNVIDQYNKKGAHPIHAVDVTRQQTWYESMAVDYPTVRLAIGSAILQGSANFAAFVDKVYAACQKVCENITFNTFVTEPDFQGLALTGYSNQYELSCKEFPANHLYMLEITSGNNTYSMYSSAATRSMCNSGIRYMSLPDRTNFYFLDRPLRMNSRSYELSYAEDVDFAPSFTQRYLYALTSYTPSQTRALWSNLG